jgi:hypothetical protein
VAQVPILQLRNGAATGATLAKKAQLFVLEVKQCKDFTLTPSTALLDLHQPIGLHD